MCGFAMFKNWPFYLRFTSIPLTFLKFLAQFCDFLYLWILLQQLSMFLFIKKLRFIMYIRGVLSFYIRIVAWFFILKIIFYSLGYSLYWEKFNHWERISKYIFDFYNLKIKEFMINSILWAYIWVGLYLFEQYLT